MLVDKDILFLLLANCLGARLFKRYWPVGGSYWNEEHIDKTKATDLKKIIKEANDYTRIHVQYMASEYILYFLFWLSGATEQIKIIPLLGVLTIYHGYAFMIHHYNRILAQERLKSIPSKAEDGKPMFYQQENQELIIKKESYDFYYRLILTQPYTMLGPYFETEKLAEQYRDQLLAKYINLYDIYLTNYYGELIRPNL